MKLKDYLKQNKIKQKDFAVKLDIGEAHLSEITNDKTLPSLKLALLIEENTQGLVTPKDYSLDIANNAVA